MKGAMNEIEVCEALKPLTMLYVDVTKAPRVGASFSTSRSELGIMGEGLGGGMPILDGFCSCPAGHGRFSGVGFWVFFGQDSRSPFWVRGHSRRFMRAFGGGSGHFRRLMRAFGAVLGVS